LAFVLETASAASRTTYAGFAREIITPRNIQLTKIIPLRFGSNRCTIVRMTRVVMKQKPTAGALRAASRLQSDLDLLQSTAELIDQETGLRELMDIFETIIGEAGDLIESRSPELLAQARAALWRFSDDTPRQSE